MAIEVTFKKDNIVAQAIKVLRERKASFRDRVKIISE
jgi:hypothetical protein